MENNDTDSIRLKTRTKDSKKAAFLKLAEKRTNSALKSLDLIANLANKYYYDYSDEQISKIFNALRERLDQAEEQYKKASDTSKKEFKLWALN